MDKGNKAKKESSSEEIQEKKETKEIVIEKKSKTLYWIRLGFFSIIFLIFFFFTALILNILPNNDTYQSFIDIIRDFTILPIKDIYALIIPQQFWHSEAIYITSAIILMFLTTGLLCGNDKFKNFLFSGSLKKQAATQIFIFFIFFIAYLRLFLYLPEYIFNMLTPIYILIGATITWLMFQSIALFRYSRSYASRTEGFLLKHDNFFTFGIVATSTFWGIIIIGGIGYVYTFIFLNIAKSFGAQIDVWRIFTLVLGAALVIACFAAFFISILSKTEKRHRIFDNFSIMTTNVVLWPYILLNLTIYFFLTSKIVGSRGAGTSQVISITDLAISVFTLVISMRGLGSKTEWKFGILKRESFILTIYAAIAGQYGIRYLLFRQQLVPIKPGDYFAVYVLFQILVMTLGLPAQNFWSLIILPSFPLNPYWNTFIIDPSLEFLINMGNLFTSIAVIGLLIGALVLYGANPEKFGKKFRVHEAGAKKGKATTQFIYDFMKQEFTRRNEPFCLFEVQEIIAKSLEMDLNITIRLINKTQLKYPDFKIDGKKKRYVCFD